MAVPWLRVLDTVLGVVDLTRSRRGGRDDAQPRQVTSGERADLEATRVPGALEARLAGVVVAALKEAFDRDSRRLEAEREQQAAERERAERALRLELHRQAGDREIGRLRLLGGIAVAAWIGTLFLAPRLGGGSIAARAALGAGWLLLLGAVAASFAAQSSVAAALGSLSVNADLSPQPRWPTTGGSVALWLTVAGLAVIGLAVLTG